MRFLYDPKQDRPYFGEDFGDLRTYSRRIQEDKERSFSFNMNCFLMGFLQIALDRSLCCNNMTFTCPDTTYNYKPKSDALVAPNSVDAELAF